jgi:hypothetical protein
METEMVAWRQNEWELTLLYHPCPVIPVQMLDTFVSECMAIQRRITVSAYSCSPLAMNAKPDGNRPSCLVLHIRQDHPVDGSGNTNIEAMNTSASWLRTPTPNPTDLLEKSRCACISITRSILENELARLLAPLCVHHGKLPLARRTRISTTH